MLDLGTLGGSNSEAYSINNRGQVVGIADTAGANHAFIYSGGHMQDLGTLGGSRCTASAINESGQIVGQSEITGDSTYHAFLYSDGKLQDLNNLVAPNSGFILYSANAINDRGQIVGYGPGPLLNGHAFLLTPVNGQ